MQATGTQRITSPPGTPATCHAAYRYVVDATPKGHPQQGQRIHVSSQSSWWSTWAVADFAQLGPGDHNIAAFPLPE